MVIIKLAKRLSKKWNDVYESNVDMCILGTVCVFCMCICMVFFRLNWFFIRRVGV